MIHRRTHAARAVLRCSLTRNCDGVVNQQNTSRSADIPVHRERVRTVPARMPTHGTTRPFAHKTVEKEALKCEADNEKRSTRKRPRTRLPTRPRKERSALEVGRHGQLLPRVDLRLALTRGQKRVRVRCHRVPAGRDAQARSCRVVCRLPSSDTRDFSYLPGAAV
jgi:hypothetical protein